MSVQTRIANITAEYAKKLLSSQHNGQLRRKNQRHIDRLAFLMKSGKWQDLNGDTIVIDTDNKVIDGQHRLEAVIKSESCIVTLLVTGVKPESFYTIDIDNRPRRATDILSIEGYRNCSKLATVIRLLSNYKRGYSPRQSAKIITSNDYIEMANCHNEALQESIKFTYRTRHVISNASAAFCHFVFSEIDTQAANKFFSQLASGINLSQENPIRLLRDRLLMDKAAKTKLPLEEKLALCIICWNAIRLNKPLKTLRWTRRGKSKQTFPVAI